MTWTNGRGGRRARFVEGPLAGNGRTTQLLANLVFFAAWESRDAVLTYDWDVDKPSYIDLLREYDLTRDSSRLAGSYP